MSSPTRTPPPTSGVHERGAVVVRVKRGGFRHNVRGARALLWGTARPSAPNDHRCLQHPRRKSETQSRQRNPPTFSYSYTVGELKGVLRIRGAGVPHGGSGALSKRRGDTPQPGSSASPLIDYVSSRVGDTRLSPSYRGRGECLGWMSRCVLVSCPGHSALRTTDLGQADVTRVRVCLGAASGYRVRVPCLGAVSGSEREVDAQTATTGHPHWCAISWRLLGNVPPQHDHRLQTSPACASPS